MLHMCNSYLKIRIAVSSVLPTISIKGITTVRINHHVSEWGKVLITDCEIGIHDACVNSHLIILILHIIIFLRHTGRLLIVRVIIGIIIISKHQQKYSRLFRYTTLAMFTTKQIEKFDKQRNVSTLCGSRKYPDSDPGGNWKFQRGGGGQRPRKFQRGGGLDNQITFQGVNIISFSTWVRTFPLLSHESIEKQYIELGFPSRYRGYSFLSFQNSEILFFSLFCLNFVVESLTCSAFPARNGVNSINFTPMKTNSKS